MPDNVGRRQQENVQGTLHQNRKRYYYKMLGKSDISSKKQNERGQRQLSAVKESRGRENNCVRVEGRVACSTPKWHASVVYNSSHASPRAASHAHLLNGYGWGHVMRWRLIVL